MPYHAWILAARLLDAISITYSVVECKQNLCMYYICDCLSENPPSLHLLVFREIPF